MFAPLLASLLLVAAPAPSAPDVSPLPEAWDYAPAMQKVAAAFRGKPGVVLHVGDSITYANPYGQWARAGQGKTPADEAVLRWMHLGADDDTDGWWLARFDHPDGGRSHTAAGGLRVDELLAGGKQGLPSLAGMLARYRPQIVVLMLGTNDASAGRSVEQYAADIERAVEAIVAAHAVPILSTIPPHPHRRELAASYSAALRRIARERALPLIDYEQEILRRRPNDWNGTLLARDDVHPTAAHGGVDPASAPTPENLRASGYLLRGWLSVRKIAEVKRRVIDPLAASSAPPASAPPAAAPPTTAPPLPRGAALRLPVTRDTRVSSVPSEAEGNGGGASRLKLKSYQEMALVDLDPAPLKGRVITAAALHVRSDSADPLRRVTVGSIAADWTEGAANAYEPQPGGSSFAWSKNPDVSWAWPGSDLTAVTLGQGGTRWHSADASPPDAEGWQVVPVDPRVVAARVADLSGGFLVFDDTGTEWTREGERFTLHPFPNRTVHSRDSQPRYAPYFSVWLGVRDTQPPGVPEGLTSDAAGLRPGEAIVLWTTPADRGPAGTVGFRVEAAGSAAPRWLVPAAGVPGERVEMHLADMGLAPGAEVEVAVSAVDGAGNVGPAATARVRTAAPAALEIPGTPPGPFAHGGELPRLGTATIAIVDTLDKVQPLTGEMIPPQEAGYLAANHLWSAAGKRVRLAAARNERVGFQILIEGPVSVAPALEFAGEPLASEFGEVRTVMTERGPLGDPVVPLAGAVEVTAAQKRTSLLCEIYVPHRAAAGRHAGTLTLAPGGQALRLDIELWVWDFTLPDRLSFIPEMNAYSLPENERDYYRLAHRHRTVINRLPYSQRGEITPGCAPQWDGERFNWSAWDNRFGPLLDGSAFADLPRAGVPLEVFYLPLHENWPTPMEGHYNGSYWADEAFAARYRAAFVAATRQMAEHFAQAGWRDTIFQCLLNNKHNYKERGWSRGSSVWLLDEPASFQDFWALKWFGEAFHEGVAQAAAAGHPARMLFRADISRPQWQRDLLDGVLDYNVVAGGPFRRYHRIVLERKERSRQLVLDYGTTNPIEESNVQPVAWCVDSWTLAADGVVPWQTIGREDSWREADQLALFYPAPDGRGAPLPSIRLKAYERGQQDTEYLALLTKALSAPRWAVGEAVRKRLALQADERGTSFTAGEDAGSLAYERLRPQDLWSLRVQIGKVLDGMRLKAERL